MPPDLRCSHGNGDECQECGMESDMIPPTHWRPDGYGMAGENNAPWCERREVSNWLLAHARYQRSQQCGAATFAAGVLEQMARSLTDEA